MKTGMIYLARGAEDEATLEEMLGHARLNQVAGVRRLSLAEVAALEPGLCLAGVTAALHSAEETIVDSWLLSMTHVHGLAVAGVEARTSCEVTAVARTEAGDWAAATSQGTVRAACVINCAGNFGDNVEKMGRDVNIEYEYHSNEWHTIFHHFIARTLHGDPGQGRVPGVQRP